ncbi:MAG: hypothetical protein R2911_05180 [Caldilineaceae bacterium]
MGATARCSLPRDLEAAAALNAETLLLDELDESEALELLGGRRGDAAGRERAGGGGGNLHAVRRSAAGRGDCGQRRQTFGMKLAQMVERLGHQQQRLALEISDRAVRSSFEVSWAALDEELQGIFPLLAVFEGRSFTAEATAHLAELTGA